jgi:hypothetical protein
LSPSTSWREGSSRIPREENSCLAKLSIAPFAMSFSGVYSSRQWLFFLLPSTFHSVFFQNQNWNNKMQCVPLRSVVRESADKMNHGDETRCAFSVCKTTMDDAHEGLQNLLSIKHRNRIRQRHMFYHSRMSIPDSIVIRSSPMGFLKSVVVVTLFFVQVCFRCTASSTFHSLLIHPTVCPATAARAMCYLLRLL